MSFAYKNVDFIKIPEPYTVFNSVGAAVEHQLHHQAEPTSWTQPSSIASPHKLPRIVTNQPINVKK